MQSLDADTRLSYRARIAEAYGTGSDRLLAARFLLSAARAMTGVIVPIYLAEIGYSAVDLGFLFALIGVASAAISAVVGVLSDRVGRKPFLVVVPLMAALAALSFGLTTATAVLVSMAAIGTFGRGSGAGAGMVGPHMPAESALASELAPPKRRNHLFGALASASAAGALLGSVLAGLPDLLRSSHASSLSIYRPAFLLMAALSLAASLVVVPLKEAPRPARQGRGRQSFRFPRQSFNLVWKLWITNGVNGLAVGMFAPFLTYWLHVRFGASASTIGVLYAVVNLASIGANLSAAHIATKAGTVRTIVAVRVTQSLLLIPMALSPNLWVAGAILLVRMTIARIGMPLRQSFVVGAAHPEERASVAALGNVVAQVTMAGSPLVAGFLFESVSLSLPLEIAGVLQFVNAILFQVFFRDVEAA
jgi:MFS family permease